MLGYSVILCLSFIFNFVCVCFACVYVCLPYMLGTWRPEEGVESSGIGVTEGCEPPGAGPLQE